MSFSGFVSQKQELFFDSALLRLLQAMAQRISSFYCPAEAFCELKWAKRYRKLCKALQAMEKDRQAEGPKFSEVPEMLALSKQLKTLFQVSRRLV